MILSRCVDNLVALFPERGILKIGLIIKQTYMLMTIAIVLVLLWLLGVIGFHVVAWFIHLLLVLAVILVLVRIIQGRNPVA